MQFAYIFAESHPHQGNKAKCIFCAAVLFLVYPQLHKEIFLLLHFKAYQCFPCKHVYKLCYSPAMAFCCGVRGRGFELRRCISMRAQCKKELVHLNLGERS